MNTLFQPLFPYLDSILDLSYVFPSFQTLKLRSLKAWKLGRLDLHFSKIQTSQL